MIAVNVTASTRRAALVAHAMQPDDRHWLLQALAPDERTRLQDLLQELQTLRIPADDDLLRELMASRPRTPLQRLEQLTDAEASALVQALRQDATALARTLLALRAWSWRARVASELGLEPAAGGVRPAPALERALCQAVVQQLDGQCLQVAAPVPATGRWRQLFGGRR